MTMRRFGRRLDVDRLRSRIPCHAVLLRLPPRRRHAAIDEPQPSAPGRLPQPRPGIDRAAPVGRIADEAAGFLSDARGGHEGVMVKSLIGRLRRRQPRRSVAQDQAARTLDLVVLAAEWGTVAARAGCRTCIWARAIASRRRVRHAR